MTSDIFQAIKEYKARHPEVDEIMRKFQIAQDSYERALSIMFSANRQLITPSYSSTTQGEYYANVSKSNR
jgi:hypothetical protein